jgi:hypothetical protein
MTKDEIITKMVDEIPYELNPKIIPYIKEAMEMWGQQVYNESTKTVIRSTFPEPQFKQLGRYCPICLNPKYKCTCNK